MNDIRVRHFHCSKGGSDKFYSVADLHDVGKAIIVYGKAETPGQSCSVVSPDYAASKIREKLSRVKGYSQVGDEDRAVRAARPRIEGAIHKEMTLHFGHGDLKRTGDGAYEWSSGDGFVPPANPGKSKVYEAFEGLGW